MLALTAQCKRQRSVWHAAPASVDDARDFAMVNSDHKRRKPEPFMQRKHVCIQEQLAQPATWQPVCAIRSPRRMPGSSIFICRLLRLQAQTPSHAQSEPSMRSAVGSSSQRRHRMSDSWEDLEKIKAFLHSERNQQHGGSTHSSVVGIDVS